MARIICFTDNAIVAQAMEQSITDHNHLLHLLPASQLTNEFRETVKRLRPDVIFLELSQTLDSLHLYYFLRSDQATRHIPIIFLSPYAPIAQQAALFGADGYVQRPIAAEQIKRAVSACLTVAPGLAAA